jgi:hypothetical protein
MRQEIIEEHGWEIFGKIVDSANLPPEKILYESSELLHLGLLHITSTGSSSFILHSRFYSEYSRPRTIYMMVSERLVSVPNAPMGFSLLLHGMEISLSNLPLGFFHLGQRTHMPDHCSYSSPPSPLLCLQVWIACSKASEKRNRDTLTAPCILRSSFSTPLL